MSYPTAATRALLLVVVCLAQEQQGTDCQQAPRHAETLAWFYDFKL